METPRNGLLAFGVIGGVLAALGIVVLIVSTDFDPNPFMEDQSNQTGQIAGVVVASTGMVVLAIEVAAAAICLALQRQAD